ncbi:MAG: hypothetical protein AAB209_05250, partial [Bacteroidota bacterium]
FRRFDMKQDWDDDIVIDVYTPEEGAKFRREADKLKRELEKMKNNLHDKMIDLKNRLQKEVGRIRASINV